MSSANVLTQVLNEFLRHAEPPTRGQLKEEARAVLSMVRDCRTDEEFRESLSSRQREVLGDKDGVRIGDARHEPVKDVVGLQVDVSAQYKVTCNSYKEILGKMKIYELDVMLEDRHIEELRLESLEVKYTINDCLAKMAQLQELTLPESN